MIKDVVLRWRYGFVLMERADAMLSALLNAYDGRRFAQDVFRIRQLQCQHLQFNRPIWELFWQEVLPIDTLQRLAISFDPQRSATTAPQQLSLTLADLVVGFATAYQ